jgi:hypothetical protein
MGHPSASALDRVDACPVSAVAPGVDSSGGYAEDGLVIHGYLEAAEADPIAALAAVPDDLREKCEGIDLAAIPRGAAREVALGYDLDADAAIVYRLDGHRHYPDDGLWHGTADLVGIVEGRAFVRDFKSYTATRASQSLQLAMLGLAAARASKLDEADVGMMVLRGDGRWFVDRHVLDAFDLMAVRDKLRSIRDRVATAREAMARGEMPAAHVGDHCRHCPAARVCPAQAALVRTAAGWEVATIAERIAALSDEDAGIAYQQVVLVERIAEAAKKALQDRARVSPIPLPGGKVLRECDWTGEKQSEQAKAQMAALKQKLRDVGEIRKASTTQVRAVNASKAGA